MKSSHPRSALSLLRSSCGRVARTVLEPLGLEIRRKPQPQPVAATTCFYEMPASCQIANLDFLYTFFLGRKTSGYFVEVGAYDGVAFSNTWGLAERGWSGLLVEPVPAFAERCRVNHAAHPAVRVVNAAVGDGTSPTVSLRVAGPHSTAAEAAAEEYTTVSWAKDSVTEETVTVRSASLDALLREQGAPEDFDLLVVDVEGSESQVFAGFTIRLWKPRLVIIELADAHPDLTAFRQEHFSLSQEVQSQGYGICYKDSINTVFVRRDILHAAYGLPSP